MGEPIQLVKGTSEFIFVDLTDRFKEITDLSVLSPVFDVKRLHDENWILVGQAAVAEGLQLRCLIDTTIPEFDISGEFELYVQLDSGDEDPRIGPIPFELIGAPAVPTVREIRLADSTLVVRQGLDGVIHVKADATVVYDLA